MPFLLYLYITTEILSPFFAAFLIINGVLFLGRLMQFLDTIFSMGIGLADFIRICAYIFPYLLLFSIPMASMLGIIMAFTRMSNDNEILALKAGGVGLHTMLPPVIFFALMTGILTSVSSTLLIPAGTVAMKKTLFQLAKEKIDKGMIEKKFSDSLNDVVLYVDKIDRAENKWQGVYVADNRDSSSPLTVLARTGSLDARIEDMSITLSLADGSIHRRDGEFNQTIKFNNYTLNLPLEAPQFVAGESATSVGKREMTLTQLRQEAARLGRDSEGGITLLFEYHKRLAMPVGCFILSIMGLPLALLQVGPNRRRPGLALSLGFFLIYYILIAAGKSLSEGGALPVAVVMWTPNILFTFLTLYLIRATARENPGFPILLAMNLANRITSVFTRQGRERRR